MADRPETPRTETRPLPWRRLVGAGVGFAVLASVSVSGLFLVYGPTSQGRGDAAPEPEATERYTDQRVHRRAFEAEETALLSTLAWADRDRGVARVPVEAAMRLIAERGLPDWDRAPPGDGLEDLIPRLPQGAGPPAPSAAPEAGR